MSEEVFVITKVTNIVTSTYAISDFNGEKNCWNFLQKRTACKTNQKIFRIEKVIKRKGIKLYIKWKG